MVVYNQGDKALNISMEYDVHPYSPFIRLLLSPANFTLRPGESRRVHVEISVGRGAAPGTYDIGVVASIMVEMPGRGSVAVPAGAQYSRLVVTGESAEIMVRSVDRAGKPVPARLRLFRVTPRKNYTVAESTNGTLRIRVAPGPYVVTAYVAAIPLNTTYFEMRAGETKVIGLIVSTVHFEYLDAVPALDAHGRLGFTRVIGVVENLLAPLENSSISLVVRYEGEIIDNITIARLPLLPRGRSEYKYNYIPSTGWRSGVYGFKLVLVSNGVTYAETEYKEVVVTGSMVRGAAGRRLASTILPLAAIAALLVAAAYMRRRRGIRVEVLYDEDRRVLVVSIANPSRREARLRRINVLAAERLLKSIKTPVLRPFRKPVLPPRSTGIIEIPDPDGSMGEAISAEGIEVIVVSDRGKQSIDCKVRMKSDGIYASAL